MLTILISSAFLCCVNGNLPDNKNCMTVEGYSTSYHSAYDFAKNAYDNGENLGIVKFYNPDKEVGYYYCYYTAEETGFVFVDPETGKTYTYTGAKYRLSSGIEMHHTTFYYYYPHTSYNGVGFVPNYMNFVNN